jgi:hypothetical protein
MMAKYLFRLVNEVFVYMWDLTHVQLDVNILFERTSKPKTDVGCHCDELDLRHTNCTPVAHFYLKIFWATQTV